MPDRIIRDELLESERWLSLKDNADRLAYIAILLKADSLGNFSAEPFRLMRLWRDFGIGSVALVSKTLDELADHDLVRLYEHDKKPFLHVPRFGQRTRYLKRIFPPSPWTSIEHKQILTKNSPVSSQACTAEVKRSEVKRSKTLAQNTSFARFWESYPKRKSKVAAEKAFLKISPSEQLLSSILSALEQAKTSADWIKEDGRWIPYPETWLRGRRWEDEMQSEKETFPI